MKDKTLGGKFQISIRANDSNKYNFAPIFLYLTEWFQQQTLSNFAKTIIRLRLSEHLGGEYSPVIHFAFGE